ncbi:conserved membrane hypothetical protein [Hyella patelloides LEGE 07179]|uniref:DUF4079 domain-containing protein n=1 Tax=Hyella patelloides LEGE 07179 TaxID=945734 RepID=A0A563VSI5_9CYAN|nr:DUF4079 domain-containing protein [Hyella patelloides]VEP14408.1 conserved membrane hypothetical protein [Hyella patelloides LEGE 07179]
MAFEIPDAVKTWSQFGHPITMLTLFGLAIYALYLGIQSRRTRTADKEVRKELVKKQFGAKHHKIGSILLALVVLGNMGGMAVTYINNGKLFVGSHLIAGLGMVAILAISTALVPYMQKGNEVARYSHISLNITMLGIFGWQAITGVQILQRIIEKMSS